MSRINTNVQSLIGQRVLAQNTKGLNQSLERLSTGLRINRGKDDPAGLIASEALRGEKSALNSAITNADRADQVANIAEGGLSQVSSLLTDLQGLVTSSANTAGISDDEKKANQLQIDSILQTIDRISGSTSFQGKKLLNGNLDYTISGVTSSKVTDFRVNGAKVDSTGHLDVNAVITQSAQQGQLYLSTNGALDLGGSGKNFTIEIGGSQGSRQLSFASGTTLSDIKAAINTFTSTTGVVASATSTGIALFSKDYGSSQFTSVKVVDDAGITGTGVGIYKYDSTDAATVDSSTKTLYTAATTAVRDDGQNVGATINGIAATGEGLVARVNTDVLDAEITFAADTATTKGAVTGSGTPTFRIDGGGADFQLDSKVNIAGRVSIGIGNSASRNLGNSTLGFLSSLSSGSANAVDTATDLSTAQDIVAAAIKQVADTRGRIGAFQKNTVAATVNNLNVSLENTTAAESSIRDADFAAETSNLTRNQILVSAATTVLGQANQAPQSALQLLR